MAYQSNQKTHRVILGEIMTKPKGWQHESQRHALASRRINTKYPVNNMYKGQHISTPQIKYSGVVLHYDSNGILLPSEGIKEWFSGIAKKASDFGHKVAEKAQQTGESISTKFKSGVEKVKTWNEEREQKKWDKDVQEGKDKKVKAAESSDMKDPDWVIAKKLAEDKKANPEDAKDPEWMAIRQKKIAEEIKTKEVETESTSDSFAPSEEETSPTDIAIGESIGSKLTSMVKNLGSTESFPSSSEMNDVTKDMFTSADADSIIATSENKEKLILYESKLKRTIDLFNTEKKTKLGEYRNEETYLHNQIRNERTLAKKHLDAKIRLISTSGMPKETVHAKVSQLKNNFNMTFSNKELNLKNLKNQHHADTEYINRISNNLNKSRQSVERKLRMIKVQ
jgi:hypothetical protein